MSQSTGLRVRKAKQSDRFVAEFVPPTPNDLSGMGDTQKEAIGDWLIKNSTRKFGFDIFDEEGIL